MHLHILGMVAGYSVSACLRAFTMDVTILGKAIMCTSLVKPALGLAERLDDYLQTWTDVCGKKVGFDPTIMISERTTADRNNALAYMMKVRAEHKSARTYLHTNPHPHPRCTHRHPYAHKNTHPNLPCSAPHYLLVCHSAPPPPPHKKKRNH